MRPLRLRLPVGLVLAALFTSARPAAAVEIRRIEAPVLYDAALVRAYAPCTAPNTVTAHGQPACVPAATSTCKFHSGTLQITEDFAASITVSRLLVPNSDLCKNGEYRLALTYRGTFTENDDVSCGSRFCTTPDTTEISAPFTIANGSSSPDVVGFGGARIDGSFEILGAVLIAPDGLPMGAAAIGQSPVLQIQNLSVGYASCTSPEPGYQACDAEPWDSPCDFTSGTVTFASIGPASIIPRVRNLAGASPLCTTGTYQVETRARITLRDCGPEGADLCTLPDAAYASPIPIVSSGLAMATGFPGLDSSLIETAEIRGFRVLDPTGGTLAAAAVPIATALRKTRVTQKDDHLRVRGLFPAGVTLVYGLDPARDGDVGATFTLHDRTGVIHTVTIPAAAWQLQPPLGERWEYKDKGGIRSGVRKIRIRLQRKRGVPIGWDVQLAADGVDLSASDLGNVTFTMTSAIRENAFRFDPRVAQTTLACTPKGTKKLCE